MRNRFVLGLFALCLLALPARSAEIALGNSVAVDRNGVQRTETVIATVTAAVTPAIDAGLAVAFEPSDILKTGAVDLIANYKLPSPDKGGVITPYVGLAFGVTDVEGLKLFDTSGLKFETRYGGQIGIKHSLGQSAGFFGEVNYRASTDGKWDAGRTLVLVGLTYKLS